MECVVRSRCPGAVPGQKRRLPELTGKFSRVHQREESKIAAQIAKAQIAALRGDRKVVAELTAEAESVALPIGAPGLLSVVLYARGTLELGYGRHTEAYEHLRRIHEPGDAACHYLNTRQMSGDFVEAAVCSGHRDEALTFVRELEPLARRPPSPWFGLQMLYARLYLATDEEAGAAFGEALSRDLAAWPVVQARGDTAGRSSHASRSGPPAKRSTRSA